MGERDAGVTGAPGVLGRLLLTWRHLLGQLVVAPTSPGAASGPDTAIPGSWLTGRPIVWVGLCGLLGGVAINVAITPEGEPRLLAAVAAIELLVWAAVRLLLMRLTASRTAIERHAVRGAWALSCCVYVIAATPELRAAAWAVSAGVAWFALLRLGEDRRDAFRPVAVAWGAQAIVMLASWLARAAYLAYLTTWG